MLYLIEVDTPRLEQACDAMLPLPNGIPDGFSLYAVPYWDEQRTLVYICNSTNDSFGHVEVEINEIMLGVLVRLPATAPWPIEDVVHHKDVISLPARACVQINVLSHLAWDFVNHYRVTLKEAKPETVLEQEDREFNASRLAQERSIKWLPLVPLREATTERIGKGEI